MMVIDRPDPPGDSASTGATPNATPDATPGATPDATDARRRLVLITGMSGAGKTSVMKVLEDLGYEAVDHVPISLLPRLVQGDEAAGAVPRPLAVGVDIRTRDFEVPRFLAAVQRLVDDAHADVRLLFLDCDDEELRRRYTATRHRHPLATDRPIMDGIALERQTITELRSRADLVIDTTGLPLGALKRLLDGHFGGQADAGLTVLVTSFSFRLGLPREADLVLDVRFLSNPFYDPVLRELTGRDPAVAEYVERDDGLQPFLDSLFRLLAPLLPRYAAEGKSYLTIGVGCTGGRHRSVYVARRLGAWLREQGHRTHVHDRDLDRTEG
jgi:RNase adapter protein RapZ